MKSETDAGVLLSEGLLSGLIGVSTDEVLEEELRVGEVRGIILEGLSVAAHQSLLEISGPPDPSLHLVSSEEMLTLLDELVSAKLNILIEEVTAENLLAIFVVDEVAHDKETSEGDLHTRGDMLTIQ